MKIHDYAKYPEGCESRWCGIEPLADYEIESLERLGVDEAWYWYAAGSYEGMGQILIKKGDNYYLHEMGHCSCYGPLDDISFATPYTDLDAIKNNCSEDSYKEIAPLVEMAKASMAQQDGAL